MKPLEIIDQSTTPDGLPLELTREGGHYVIRIASKTLMSSASFGSEQTMARIAADAVGRRRNARVLVGGLGMGFTVRGALDAFGRDVRVTVAELLPEVVRYNRSVYGHLAGHPLTDRRVELFEGDVRVTLGKGGWDAVLLDVDNGPDAFTVPENADLYDDAGARELAGSLTRGGIAVIWSAYPSRHYERTLRRAGLSCEMRRVRARAGTRKGGKDVLFVARRPV